MSNPTEEHLEYLDELRESGETNTFRACHCLENKFNIPTKEAKIFYLIG